MSRLMLSNVDLEKMSSEDLINSIKNDSVHKECCVVIMEKHLNMKDLLNLKEFQMVRWGYSKAIIEKMMILITQMREKTRIVDEELYRGYMKMQPNVISKKLDFPRLTLEEIKSEPRNLIKNPKCPPKPSLQREKEGNQIEGSNQCDKIISPRKDSSEDYYDGMGYLNPRKVNVPKTNSSKGCQRFNTDPFKKTKTGSSEIAGRKPLAPPRHDVAQEPNVYEDPHSMFPVKPDFTENDYESVSSMQENSVRKITHDTEEIYAEPDDQCVRDDLENLGGQDIDPTTLPKKMIQYTNPETLRSCCYSKPANINALELSLNKSALYSMYMYPSSNNNNKEQSTFVNQNATSSTESNPSKIKNIKGNSKNSQQKPSYFKSFSDRPLPPLPLENMERAYADTEHLYSDPSHMTAADANDKIKECNKGPEEEFASYGNITVQEQTKIPSSGYDGVTTKNPNLEMKMQFSALPQRTLQENQVDRSRKECNKRPEEEFASYGNITVQEQTRIPLSGYDGVTTKNPNLEKKMQFPALPQRTLQENQVDRSRKNVEEHALVETEDPVEYENENTKEAYRQVQEQTRIPLSGDGVTIKIPNLKPKMPFLTLLQRTLQDKKLTNETNKRPNMEHALVRTEKELVDHKNETTKDTSIKVQEQIRIPLSGHSLTTKTSTLEKKMHFPALPQRTLLGNVVIIDRSRKNVEHALVEANKEPVRYNNENTKEASRKVEESTKTISLGHGIITKPLSIESKIVTLQRTLQDKEVINDRIRRCKEEHMLVDAEEELVEYENENTKDSYKKVKEPNKMSHLGVTTKTQSLETKNNFATVLQRALQDKEVKNDRSRRSKEEHMLVEAEEEPVEYENESTKDAYRKVKEPNKMPHLGVTIKTKSLETKNNFASVLQRTLQDKEVRNDRSRRSKEEHMLVEAEEEPVEYENESTKDAYRKVKEPNKMPHLGVTIKTKSLETKNNFASVLQRTLQDKEVRNDRSRRSKEEHMLVEAEEEPVEYENESTKDAYRKVKEPNTMSCFGITTKTQTLERKNNFATVLQRTLEDKEVKNDRSWTKAEHVLLVKEKESVDFKNEITKEIFKKAVFQEQLEMRSPMRRVSKGLQNLKNKKDFALAQNGKNNEEDIASVQEKGIKTDQNWRNEDENIKKEIEQEQVDYENEITEEMLRKGPSPQIKVDTKQNLNSKPIVFKLDNKLASNLKEALLNKKKELASRKNPQEEYNSRETNTPAGNMRLTNIKLPKPPTSILVPIPCLEPAIQPVCKKLDDDEEYVEFLANINDHEFYRNTDRKGAKQLLRNLGNGAFVLRPSNMYSLSLTVKSNEKYFHLGINKDPHTKKLYIGKDKFATPEFSSLHELISYYEDNPLIVKVDEHIQDVFLTKLLTRDNY